MVETVVSLVVEVDRCLVAPMVRPFMYLYNYKSNFNNLENEVLKLKSARDEVLHQIEAAERKMERIRVHVIYWLEVVNSIISDAEKVIEEKANSRCFKGFCPNLMTRYKHSKEALKKLETVDYLLWEKSKFAEVSYTIATSVKGYEVFESRQSTVKDIMDALNDVNVDMIGIYGMGGIGKTALVKEVGRQVKEYELFDVVIFIEVSDTPDLKKIQEEIADRLALKFNAETGRADELYYRLRNIGEKILVILDNIWESLDFLTVGIPSGAYHGGCKVLLTTRDLNVLLSMDSQCNFPLGVLTDEEAWSLFKKIAGDVIEERELRSLAKEVAKECGGLPIALVTVARALRNKKHPFQWREALQQLRMPSPENFRADQRRAYSIIELSYLYLRSQELKETFLLCSLMGDDASILDLWKYAMGLDIFQGIYTMEYLRDRVEAVIHELKDSCLLLDGQTSELFSIHYFVRAVAISIAARDYHVFHVRNDSKWKWPDKDVQKICTKIFIHDSPISEPPDGLECPQLELLYMSMKDSSFKNLENFFKGMTKLKVLNLFYFQQLSLPSSLNFLLDLQTLCLDYGKFEDIAIIGELNKLKILSLRHSNVKQLPREIGQLTELRFLDLSNCRQLKVIAPNVISKLSRLEELSMSGCSMLWEVKGLDVEISNAILEEFKHLSHLTTLEIDIQDDRVIPRGLFSKKLERYNISIGDGSSTFGSKSTSSDHGHSMLTQSLTPSTLRTLKLKLNSIIFSNELLVFKNVEFLCIDKLQGIENVLYDVEEEGFSQLKHLCVHNNPKILCIVDKRDDASPAFPLLESLILFNMIELKKICHGQPKTGSFCNLKIIEVLSCNKLQNIFLLSDARSLPQLQRIRVVDCQNVKEIFSIEREDNFNNIEVADEIEFLQLRFLTLNNLPKLANFSEVNSPSTSQMRQKEDELDTSLFDKKVVFPKLEALELDAINIVMIWPWDSQLPTMYYQNLTRLIVKNCEKLQYVFPFSVVDNFEQLQHLEICNCRVLKEVVGKEGPEIVATLVFPGVIFLKLENLPELETFCHGIPTFEWPMLEKLEVCDCDKLKIFTSEYLIFKDIEFTIS